MIWRKASKKVKYFHKESNQKNKNGKEEGDKCTQKNKKKNAPNKKFIEQRIKAKRKEFEKEKDRR